MEQKASDLAAVGGLGGELGRKVGERRLLTQHNLSPLVQDSLQGPVGAQRGDFINSSPPEDPLTED